CALAQAVWEGPRPPPGSASARHDHARLPPSHPRRGGAPARRPPCFLQPKPRHPPPPNVGGFLLRPPRHRAGLSRFGGFLLLAALLHRSLHRRNGRVPP